MRPRLERRRLRMPDSAAKAPFGGGVEPAVRPHSSGQPARETVWDVGTLPCRLSTAASTYHRGK